MIGLFLLIPVPLVASMLYCFFVDRVVVKFERTRRWLLITSYIVLSFFAVELVMLESFGAVRSSAIVGPRFFHFVSLTLSFLVVPSLANCLLLNQRRRFAVGWYAAAFLCTVFALFLVLLQSSVSESLYGIE